MSPWERAGLGSFQFRSKSGGQFLVNATGAPLFSDDGHLMGVVCISCDSRTYKQLSGNHLITVESSSSSSSSTNKNSSTVSKSTSNGKSQVAVVSKFSNWLVTIYSFLKYIYMYIIFFARLIKRSALGTYFVNSFTQFELKHSILLN